MTEPMFLYQGGRGRHLVRSGDLEPIWDLMRAYRTAVLRTADQLTKLSEQLTAEKGDLAKSKMVTNIVTAVGSAGAVSAGIAGLFVAAPVILPILLVFSTVAAGTGAANQNFKRKENTLENGVSKRFQMIENSLEEEFNKLNIIARELFEDVHGRESTNVLERMNAVVGPACSTEDHTGDISGLRNLLKTMLETYNMIPIECRDGIQNLFSFCTRSFNGGGYSSLVLFPQQLSQSATISGNSSPSTSTLFEGLNGIGKAVYLVGLTVNVANLTVSSIEANKLQRLLIKLKKATLLADQVAILGGLAEEIHSRGKCMKDFIQSAEAEEFSIKM